MKRDRDTIAVFIAALGILCGLACGVAHAEPPGRRATWHACPTPEEYAAIAGDGPVIVLDAERAAYVVSQIEEARDEIEACHAERDAQAKLIEALKIRVGNLERQHLDDLDQLKLTEPDPLTRKPWWRRKGVRFACAVLASAALNEAIR